MDTRQQIAADLVEFFVAKNLAQVYGSEIGQGTNKIGRTYYTVTFCRAYKLDGVVNIYGPNFIQIKWQGAARDLGRRGSEVFRSVADAEKFLWAHFV
ncbi:MAG: hypothetical protein N2235_02475 [Fischerella sp.]|nr:hypothetical protein [Fischerella sp.]